MPPARTTSPRPPASTLTCCATPSARPPPSLTLTVDHDGHAVTLGFGAQTDTRIIRPGTHLPGTGQALDGQAVANYIAKYATKTLTASGVPCPAAPHGDGDLGHLRCTAHYRRHDHHRLAARQHPAPLPGCRAWAHMLGYGGHFLTKSRRYSVTFGQLRNARTDHRRATRPPGSDRDAWGRPLDETVVLVLPTTWTCGGPDLNPTTPDR